MTKKSNKKVHKEIIRNYKDPVKIEEDKKKLQEFYDEEKFYTGDDLNLKSKKP